MEEMWQRYGVRAGFGLLVTVLLADALLTVGGGRGPQLSGLNLANLVAFGATALLLAALVAHPTERRRWLPLAAGMVSYSLAFVVYAELVARQHPIPYPSAADALWLAIYPGAYATIILLARGRIGSVDAGMWLDGVVAALAVAALGAAFVFRPVLDGATGGAAAVATNIAYPIGDVTLLALVVGTLVVTGLRPARTWLLVGAGFAVFAIGDSVYVTLATTGQYVTGHLLDVTWPAGLLLIAAASWQPQAEAVTFKLHGLRRLVLALPSAAVALGLLIAGGQRIGDSAVVLAVSTLAFSLVRMAYAVVLEGRLHATRTQALTDDLTGLGNRRLLLEDLRGTLASATAQAPSALVLFDLNGFKHYNDTFGHIAGDELLVKLAQRLAGEVGDSGCAYRLGGDEFCALLTGDPRSLDELLPRLEAALTGDHEAISVGCSYGVALLPQEAGDASSALALADRRMYERKEAERRSTRLQMRDLLLSVVEEQRPELHSHSSDVSQLARGVAARLGMASAEIELVGNAAELHDIGKVAIPDAIICKPGLLDDAEWELMRTHTLIGQRVLASVPALAPLAQIVRATHERWDGSGYPDRLAGERIPLPARVIGACDAFDAMTSDRPYRTALTTEQAIAELQQHAGTQFDPNVVKALVQVLAEPGAVTRAPRAASRPSYEPRLSTIASLRGLLEVTRLVRRAGSLESVLDAIARTISESLGLGTVVINLHRAGTDVFDVVTVHGCDEVRNGLLGTANSRDEWESLLQKRFHRRGAYHIRAGEFDWTALADNRVVVGQPLGDDPWLWHPEDELFVPFYSSDRELIGILSLGEPRSGRRPSDDEIEVLVAMAEHAAVVVEGLQTASGDRPRLAPVRAL